MRQITYKGETHSIREWSKILGMSEHVIGRRINKMGMTFEEAISMPIAKNERLVTYNGETRNIREWSKITGINEVTLSGRLRAGWTVEEAMAPTGTVRHKPQKKETVSEKRKVVEKSQYPKGDCTGCAYWRRLSQTNANTNCCHFLLDCHEKRGCSPANCKRRLPA